MNYKSVILYNYIFTTNSIIKKLNKTNEEKRFYTLKLIKYNL